MRELFSNPITAGIVLPLLVGIATGLFMLSVRGMEMIATLAAIVALIFVYWLLEGVPPFPPIASKQKLGYLVGMGGIAACLLPMAAWRRPAGFALTAAGTLAAFAWLGWPKFQAGMSLHLLIAFGVAILLAGGTTMLAQTDDDASPQAEMQFLNPAAILSTAFASAIIGFMGLFIGMAQFLGAIAALTGGALLVGYGALLMTGKPRASLTPTACLGVSFALSAALILTALLGPEPHPVALLIAPFSLYMPRLVAGPLNGLLPRFQWLRPVVAGALIALPALLASLVAWFGGTSPIG